MTLGQFVAAEVIVGSLLLNFDSVVKRMYVVFYFFTALTELDSLFSLPKDTDQAERLLPLPPSTLQRSESPAPNSRSVPGAQAPLWSCSISKSSPAKKMAILATCQSDLARLALVLAGLEPPESEVVRYNGSRCRSGTPPR